MAIIRVTKEFRFEMAHALYGHDGPCRHIHGHSYTLSVTVRGLPVQDNDNPKNGMVIDFGDLKRIVKSEIIDRFDHALVLNQVLQNQIPHFQGELFDKVIYLPCQPSSENLLNFFAGLLIPRMPAGVSLYCLKLRETETSYAEWHAGDNPG